MVTDVNLNSLVKLDDAVYFRLVIKKLYINDMYPKKVFSDLSNGMLKTFYQVELWLLHLPLELDLLLSVKLILG